MTINREVWKGHCRQSEGKSGPTKHPVLWKEAGNAEKQAQTATWAKENGLQQQSLMTRDALQVDAEAKKKVCKNEAI